MECTLGPYGRKAVTMVSDIKSSYQDEMLREYKKYKRGFRDPNNVLIHNMPHCVYCGRVIHDYELIDCGYSRPNRKGSNTVWWHDSCFCKTHNISYRDYIELIGREF